MKDVFNSERGAYRAAGLQIDISDAGGGGGGVILICCSETRRHPRDNY